MKPSPRGHNIFIRLRPGAKIGLPPAIKVQHFE